LIHINQPITAALIENAWLTTLEDGYHTADIYSAKYSKKKTNTDEFADAVIERLGKKPLHFKAVEYQESKAKIECYGETKKPRAKKALVGIDIFVDNEDMTPEQLGEKMLKLTGPLKAITITSRGLKIWPDCMIQAPFAQHCSCRFQTSTDTKALTTVTHKDLLDLIQQFGALGLDVIKTENLYTFDGQLGYSLAQGQ
jgi:isocitrate dehydrogenase